MPIRVRTLLKLSLAISICWCGGVHAETAVIRSSYENPIYPSADANDTNLVVYGVVGAVGGLVIHTNNYDEIFDISGNVIKSQFNIVEAQAGAPCGAAVANYGFGDELLPPLGVKEGVEPIIQQGDNLVIWLGYADKLLALDSGVAVIKWEMDDGSYQTMTYAISPNPQQRPVRLYWTDDANGNSLQNAGPTVQFGANYRVDLYSSSSVSINESNYQWIYDPDSSPSNDVWLTGSSLHAKEGTDGKFLLTYSRFDELGYQQYIAHEVVEVMRPMSEFQEVDVGDRLTPMKRKYEIEDLFSLISRGASDPSGGDEIFVYKHNAGVKNGWVWATRETDAPGQIEIYWKAKEQLDVIWPFEVDIYEITWGDELQQYVRGDLSEGDYEPSVFVPMEFTLVVMDYQTRKGASGDSADFAFADNGALYTTELGKFLLRYSTEDTVWFEPVEAVSRLDLLGTVLDQEIASEIVTQEEAYTNWPGYCYAPSRVAYNTNYYSYPDQYKEPTDITSSIFGVNRGEIEVWWSNESKFWTLEGTADNEVKLPKPIFFPSLINTCSNIWPTRARELVIASGEGGEVDNGYSNNGCCMNPLDDRSDMAWGSGVNFGTTNGITYEGWINPNIDSWQHLFYINGVDLLYRINRKLVLVDQTPTERNELWDLSPAIEIPENQWTHVAVTLAPRAGTNLLDVAFYIDAELVGGGVKTNHMPDTIDSYFGIACGNYGGAMDEVRFWDYALTPAQIKDSFDHRWTVPSISDPLVWCRFEPENPNLNEGTSGSDLILGDGTMVIKPDYDVSPAGFSLVGASPEIYEQSDSSKHGYNPNEEHALVVQDNVFALRVDLNETNTADYTSDPFVLVEYEHEDGKKDMIIFKVVTETERYPFARYMDAGQMIQTPAPLNQLQPAWCANNDFASYGLQPFEDRNGNFWAQQAGSDGGVTNTYSQFYYPNQNSFWYPVGETHEAGEQIAWSMDGSTSPVEWDYIISWPQDVPGLYIGATLTNPRDGLPAVRGQLSVDVVYQQSEEADAQPSVKLIDPTRSRKSDMIEPPTAIKNFRDPSTGYTFFGELPPALRTRMYWNGTAEEAERFQLTGEYKERTDGHNYLLLNLLSQDNRANALDPDIVSGADDEDWISAVQEMPSSVYTLSNDEDPVDSYALSTVGKGSGYVTLIFNDSTDTDMVDPSEVVDMAVILVETNLYQGRLDTLLSPNPLDQQITLKYTADFAGEPENFELEWNYADPDDGSAPEEDSSNWKYFEKDAGLHYVTIGDSGIFGLSDHYLRCRYRALDADVISTVGTNWSSWTPPQLCEGWIKRVLKAINPFEQRIRDYMNYEVDSALSMIQQAGAPYDGDIPLNYGALNDYGLIQIYQTLLGQARDLSIDANHEAAAGLSLSLLMASGRLADLYMLLGNEAYADALNPLVSLGSDDPVTLTETPSIFCFQNQVPNLLSEELCLLRGRDDSMSPTVTEYPIYNRLAWNFTADIVGGEVAYALNYGISDLKGDQDGSLDSDDAAILFPQGHGDAWGHYLTAIKGYYELLHHDFFNWYPQVEGILVGDTEVTVSYLHEKKFARAAAAKAKTGLDILNKTWRSEYAVDLTDNWDTLSDSNTNRSWGVAEWSSRVGQGTYFDWLTANSLLPDQNSNPDDSGIRIIDRVTTPELDEMTMIARKVQRQLDAVDAGMNPLGLAPGVVPFDISSSEIDAGNTHFEQIWTRALSALRNAGEIFDRVQSCTQTLRDQNEAREFDQSMADEEVALERRLIEIYGYPYSDDIGPGKAYAEGYDGPDLLHYNYTETHIDLDAGEKSVSLSYSDYDVVNSLESVDTNLDIPWHTFLFKANLTSIFLEPTRWMNVNIPDIADKDTRDVEVTLGPLGLPQKPNSFLGSRRAEGEIQIALSRYVEAINRMLAVCELIEGNANAIDDEVDRMQTRRSFDMVSSSYEGAVDSYSLILSEISDYLKSVKEQVSVLAEDTLSLIRDIASAAPTSIGFSNDIGSPIRITAVTAASSAVVAKHAAQFSLTTGEKIVRGLAINAMISKQLVLADLNKRLQDKENLWKIQDMVRAQNSDLSNLNEAAQAVETARMEYMQVIAKGDALQVERERLRMNRASDLSAKRYRNMAYQIFRNDELQRYSESFDQAARYCYLAAKSYDYETGLLGDSATFYKEIVKARTIGRMTRGSGDSPDQPLLGGPAGDPGLADVLARMKANWDVLDGRLSFNNPQTETGRFSLRSELFRIAPTDVGGESSDGNWRETLEKYRVDNLLELPEFKRYCLPFTPTELKEPALVIPFSTDINFGHNFFGRDLAGGDNAYDSTHFATKIRSAGVWFSNFDNAFDGGLANQPRVYLIPVGADSMRVPSAELDEVRTWQVVDQALPVPYPLGEQEWDAPNWSVLKDMLGNELYNIRRFPSMRAYHDSGDFDASEVINNSRLIGRSVWNTRWMLIIPGGTLLQDGEEGLDRLIHGSETSPGVRSENGIDDIKIFFETYSFSGN
ncbi:MAG: LamG domain-containing protein [Kiritimatiellae bacterium]|nr:LamG domain-containing protein [Kiritimatiellia bacterium]